MLSRGFSEQSLAQIMWIVRLLQFPSCSTCFRVDLWSERRNGKIGELLDSSVLLVIGIDPLEETPALAWEIKAAARCYDSNVIVANSRATSLD